MKGISPAFAPGRVSQSYASPGLSEHVTANHSIELLELAQSLRKRLIKGCWKSLSLCLLSVQTNRKVDPTQGELTDFNSDPVDHFRKRLFQKRFLFLKLDRVEFNDEDIWIPYPDGQRRSYQVD